MCTRRKNIGTDKEYINDDENNAIESEDMELVILNTSKKPIWKYHKDDWTPAQDVYSGEIGSVYNKVEKY